MDKPEAKRLVRSAWAETAVRNSLRTSSVVRSDAPDRSAALAVLAHGSPGRKIAIQ